jgi:hypothetical protein
MYKKMHIVFISKAKIFYLLKSNRSKKSKNKKNINIILLNIYT